MAKETPFLLLLLLLLLCKFVMGFSSDHSPIDDSDRNDRVMPYFLFTAQNSIYKVDLNGSNVKVLVQDEPSDSIQGFAYHYRRQLMFWSIRRPNVVKQANLDGSNITDIITGVDIDDIVDLRVDWINDRLYWVDRGRREIVEYNIETAQSRVLLKTGCRVQTVECRQSTPQGMAIYPNHNATTIWWVDSTKKTLETLTHNAPNEEIITRTEREFSRCTLLGPVHVDPNEGHLYMMNRCRYSISRSNFQGSDWNFIVQYLTSSIDAIRTYQMTQYGSNIYWATQNRFYTLNVQTGEHEEIFRLRELNVRVESIAVIHPSLQPQDLYQNKLCLNSCNGRGDCQLTTRLCVCDEGSLGDCGQLMNQTVTTSALTTSIVPTVSYITGTTLDIFPTSTLLHTTSIVTTLPTSMILHATSIETTLLTSTILRATSIGDIFPTSTLLHTTLTTSMGATLDIFPTSTILHITLSTSIARFHTIQPNSTSTPAQEATNIPTMDSSSSRVDTAQNDIMEDNDLSNLIICLPLALILLVVACSAAVLVSWCCLLHHRKKKLWSPTNPSRSQQNNSVEDLRKNTLITYSSNDTDARNGHTKVSSNV